MSELVEAGSYARGGRLISWISIAPQDAGTYDTADPDELARPFPRSRSLASSEGMVGDSGVKGRSSGVVVRNHLFSFDVRALRFLIQSFGPNFGGGRDG